ncbi:hypothetical protein B0T22DRAFT_520823 [Podospora appendiculata]|uniref:Nephrocystin 3-like N-terminal domain-containing protein n=1 Tax=Podospora appendiculata TaxID=314037 RepID=A0AAE0X3L3_9PEZI|nr:hypothetical protein B0T22DRAFT_520823 [Podospora appendiculata]
MQPRQRLRIALKQVLCSTSAADDVEETFVRNKRALLEGTGAWLFEEPFSNEWIQRNSAALCILGGPGSGKSFLATAIIQLLMQQAPTVAVAYFIVKENNEYLRDANIILKTLAWQLLNQDRNFKQHAVNVCGTRINTITAEDTWENLFLGHYRLSEGHSVTPAVLVFDGLDEATSATGSILIGLMKDLVFFLGKDPRPIQILVVGRGSIRTNLSFHCLQQVRCIEVSRLKNGDDINYIKKRLQTLEILHELCQLKPDGWKRASKEGGRILKRVSQGANGIFLWAKLLLDSLMGKGLSQIQAVLASPPSTLDDMISSVFARIARDEELNQDVVRKILLFMVYARRSLLFGELSIIASLPGREPNHLLWRHVRGQLSSLLELKYPYPYDPDHDHDLEATANPDPPPPESGHGAERCDSDDEKPLDFSCASDDGHEIDDVPASGGDDTDTKADGVVVEPDHTNTQKESEAFISHLSWGQAFTQVAFYHTRIRDFLAEESDAKTRRTTQK